MPTYVLEGAGRAVFPRRPIVVSMTVVGPVSSAMLRALVGGADDPRAVRPTAGLMVLPRVDAPMVLRIAPAGGVTAFPQGSSIHISLTVEDRSDPDPDRAVIGPIDVSGQTHIDVASLDSVPDGVAVVALRSAVEIELGPVASRVRVAARSLLGVDQLPERDQVDIVIAVDTSASMLAALLDGSLGAVCDMVAGLASVVAPHRAVRVCFIGSSLKWFEVSSLAEVGARISRELESGRLVSGFRPALLGAAAFGGADTVTFVVTDGAPVYGLGQVGDPGDTRHLVAITPPSDLGSAAAMTVVEPPPQGSQGSQYFAEAGEVVNQIVRSLVSNTTLGRRSVSSR